MHAVEQVSLQAATCYDVKTCLQIPSHILYVKSINCNKKSSQGSSKQRGSTSHYQGIQTSDRLIAGFAPEMFGPCTDTSAPTHDNTGDCMIIHRAICQPSHFQAPDRWGPACLPGSTSAYYSHGDGCPSAFQ